MAHQHLTDNAELWRLPRVKQTAGLGSSRIYELVSEGKFPKPVKLGPRASAWVSTEVLAWVADRIADRDAGITS